MAANSLGVNKNLRCVLEEDDEVGGLHQRRHHAPRRSTIAHILADVHHDALRAGQVLCVWLGTMVMVSLEARTPEELIEPWEWAHGFGRQASKH